MTYYVKYVMIKEQGGDRMDNNPGFVIFGLFIIATAAGICSYYAVVIFVNLVRAWKVFQEIEKNPHA